MKLKSYILSIAAAAAGAGFLGSCEDMLEPTSQYVIYDDGSHLNTPADTANSLIGIIYKLQAIGDRTHLLGEVRGDFVNVLQSADADLQDLYNFNVGDDNIYNNPRDYYAVINNCNYFIANADTNAYDNRGNRIFEKEMAQVKAIRAWTYLQLVLNYGRVPFYDRPLLTEQDAGNVSLADADRKDIEGICNYFIPDLLPYSLTEWPQLHTVGSIFMPNCYFPVDMVLGDLYLWRASVTGSRSDYREAARCYFRWIMDTRNVGDGRYKSPYIVSWSTTVEWYRYTSSLTGTSYISSDSYSGNLFGMASSLYGNETFTIIPMDSAASQGYYNKVRDLYNNAEVVGIGTISVNPEVRYSITPSAHIQEISAAQSYYYLGNDGNHYPVVVDEDDALRRGDLRLSTVWSSGTYNTTTGGMASNASWQYIEKVANRNIPVYRRTDCWLRLAEALNGGGYPRLAYAGLGNQRGHRERQCAGLLQRVGCRLYPRIGRFGRGLQLPEFHCPQRGHEHGSGYLQQHRPPFPRERLCRVESRLRLPDGGLPGCGRPAHQRLSRAEPRGLGAGEPGRRAAQRGQHDPQRNGFGNLFRGQTLLRLDALCQALPQERVAG